MARQGKLLGHIVSTNGIATDMDKIHVIVDCLDLLQTREFKHSWGIVVIIDASLSLYLDLGWCEESQSTSNWSVDFEALLEHCRFLESLSLIDQNFSLDLNAYAAITRLVSRKLTVLSLGYFPEIYAKELFNFTVEHIQSPKMQKRVFQLQNLQKLSLVLDRITDTFVVLVCESLPSLIDLELQDEPGEEPLIAFDLTTTGIQHLGVFSKLKRLSLARSQDLYPATFKQVEDLGFLFLAEKCTKLESITLAGFSRISDASCRQILHSFSNLHTFELLKSSRITDLTFRDFSAVPVKLVSVTLASCNLVSNSSIRQLSHCKDLESLNLKGCKSVGDKGLEAIASLKRLKKLILNGVDVSDMGLLTLGKGTTPLVFLSLRGCQRVSDDGISALVKRSISETLEGIDLSNIILLTDKAVLSLVHCGMRIVDLKLRDCYNIGDTSLMGLASMTSRGCGCGGSLRLLDLWNCKGLTALGMSWLKKPYFPRLRWLGLGWNTVPISMLDFLAEERPYVHILDHGVELGGRDGEEWSGEDGTFGATDKVLAFIQQFDAAFGDEGFTESSKLRHVAMHFQKSARQWWASLRANGEAPKTWKALRASIMKQFLASDAKDKVLTQWRSLKLSPYESIHKYVNKFWDLHLKATVYKKIDFEEQKQQFCAGLPEDMNEYVNSQRPRSISVVIHHTMVAARINFQQGAKRNLKPMEAKEKQEYKGKNFSQNSSKGNSNNNKAKVKGVFKGKNRLTPEELERYRKENKCFKCGEQGHSYRSCPQRNPRNEQPRASMVEAPKEEVHCKGSPLSYAWGKVREHDAFILFDPGSTHNFISLELATKLGVQDFEMGDADGGFLRAPPLGLFSCAYSPKKTKCF
ncbi:hypothetical protein L7F22_041967 [Adiantum nelumboides]|nr:hypothetical protein [Adiantum nelumboides]